MPRAASIHVQTSDLQAVRAELERALEPDFSAYVAVCGPWVSLLAEELETPDDFTHLAKPLSKLGSVIGFLGDGDLQILRFPDGLERVSWDDLKSRAQTLGIVLEQIADFDAINALDEDGALPEGFVRLEREPEKPGLKEFFGRSQDE